MKDYLNNKIEDTTLGVLYICDYNFVTNTMTVVHVLQFRCAGRALDAYANTRNPESQLASGRTREEFEEQLSVLHNRLNDPQWVKELRDYL